MEIVLKTAFCFLMAVISTAMAEVLLHRFLFHTKIKLFKFLPKLWGYDPMVHNVHHKTCREELEDPEKNDHEYWVQKPSNVFASGVGIYLVESLILWAAGFEWPYFVATLFFSGLTLVFWYKFEDHFHIAMHKQAYYKKHIEGTWQDPWFQYAKKLHAIHHKDPRYNFGFVFFPIGDLFMLTYRSDPSKINKHDPIDRESRIR